MWTRYILGRDGVNIFYLHEDPVQNAKWHIDKHIVKMPIEYAQLMSTAHRMLDGHMYIGRTANGRRIKRWKLQDERDDILYKASHVNHPSAVWVRESIENYFQMYKIYMAHLQSLHIVMVKCMVQVNPLYI